MFPTENILRLPLHRHRAHALPSGRTGAAKCIFVHWLTPPQEAAHAGWKRRERTLWNNPVITSSSSTSTQHPNNSSRCHILLSQRLPPLAAPVIAAPKLLRCHVLLRCHTGHRLAHNQMSTTAKYWPSFAAAPFHSINTGFRMTFNIVKLLNSHFWGAKNCIFLNQVLSHQACKYPVFTPSLRKCCVLSFCSHTRIEWDKRRVTQ